MIFCHLSRDIFKSMQKYVYQANFNVIYIVPL